MIPRRRGPLAAAAALLLGAALTTASCGGGGSGGKGGRLKMGIAVANYSLDFAREMYEGSTAASKRAGNVDFKVIGPPNTDGPAEQQLFQNLTVTHPDGIVLVKIIPGAVRPEGGTLELDGAPVRFADARQAAAQGVAIVSQELMTYDDLTVLENLFPYGAPRRRGLVSTREMLRLARPVLDELGIDPPPHAKAGELPLADRQPLEICRALLLEPRVLVLDEPTSALPRAAAVRLAGVTWRLAERGLAVLYISHFLEEVMRIATR